MQSLCGNDANETVSTMGGLWANAKPQDLPEGASPRCYDVDFIVGSVFTRAGLKSVYSYSGSSLGPNAPQKAIDVPLGGNVWTNPDGVLGDVAYASVAVGSQNTITADTGTAISSSTPAWSNPVQVWDSGDYTSVFLYFMMFGSPQLSATLSATPSALVIPQGSEIAGIAVSFEASSVYSDQSASTTVGPNNCASGTSTTWSNPSYVTGTSGYAFFTNSDYNTSMSSGNLTATGFGFAIPTNATILSVTVSLNKFEEFLGVTSSVVDSNVQLLKSGVPVGSNLAKSGPWPTSSTSFTYSGGLWGTTWTPADLNSSTFGVVLSAEVTAGVVVVHGVPSGFCKALVQDVTVSVSYSTGQTGNSTVTVQLTLSGTPVGNTVTFALSPTTSTCSVPSSLWGTSFAPSDINNLGVNLTANAGSTFLHGSHYLFQANNLNVSVSYLIDFSDELQATRFSFAVPASSGITGLTTAFNAYATGSATLTLQLLRNGIPVGSPKTQALTGTVAPYSLGSAIDIWQYPWIYSDINNQNFGVQVTAEGSGTVFVNGLTVLANLTFSLENFNYVKTYEQNNGQIFTLALDASGTMWREDVNNSPNELSSILSGLLPGSFAKSVTMNNREHICFSDLSIGTDRPRVYDGTKFSPLSQVGPGVSPSFQASVGSGTGTLSITAYSLVSDVVTFTISVVATAPVVGSLYTINNVVSYLNGNAYQVLATPAPTTTSFAVSLVHANDSGSVTGTAVPAYSYNIASITQNAAVSCNGQELLWSAPGNPSTVGDTVTVYYGSVDQAENATLLSLLGDGIAVYAYFSPQVPIIGGGTYLISGHGVNHPPHESAGVQGIPYISVQYTSQGNARYGGPSGSGPNGPGNSGTWQITLATITTTSAISLVEPGDNFNITGATPSGWNSNWTVIEPVNNTTLDITSSEMSSLGVATYGWTIAVGTPVGVLAPTVGQLITVQGCTNSEVFNTTGVIASVTGSNSGTLTVDGFPPSAIAQQSESGTAVTFGTSFYFDPGIVAAGSTTSPIFGNDTGTGYVTIVGGALQPIGSGTRQGVVFFITESGYETAPGPPVTFTTNQDANYISASFIPIGPPNVRARGIAFTEAGQNGVPGANFYVIEEPVVVDGINPHTYTSTIINDNTSTTAKFTFTDAVLLNSREIDIQGDNLFNLIELGSSAWCVPYAGRMFYGLQLNKVTNFNNLTFDGGYLPNPGGNIQPAGWNITNAADQTLLISTVTGFSLYIQNTGGEGSGTQTVGMITQTAYQDVYQVAIIKPATTYSVRVACSAPSGNPNGTLTIDLASPTDQTAAYGSFTVSLASMTSNMAVFEGTLLTTPFATAVPKGLLLRLYLANAAPLADCEIDRFEVFETLTPYLAAQVYGSYPGQPETIDASATGGVIDTTSENAQACVGGFVMRNLLYLLKTSSWYYTSDNPNSEPGGWELKEVSNKVGAIGINAYDVGEEWVITACRQGIYGFDGGQPEKISQELWNLWEAINWNAGNTIVVRNDVISKRLYVAIPLPTGTSPQGVALPSTQWLPNAPYNPNPTTPNVMLMLNYQGLADIKEMIASPQVHTTMFGTLAAVDMKRKWAIWNIATPYMEFILQPDQESRPLYICNGIESSKIYQLSNTQYSDDGVAINSLYTTYGFVNATKAATLPIFGFHAKRYTVLQANIEGTQTTPGVGNAVIRMLPNTINPKYPYTVPVGIPLVTPIQDDYVRSINVKGNRMFIEVSTNTVGSAFSLSKLLITGKADAWSPINPVGGGNAGIM
jgi:hypothetical protein